MCPSVNQAFGLLLVGHETTAAALTFTVYCLARYPDKAAKVAAEVDAAQGELTYASLQEGFPYTEAALREAMRLYPPGAFAFRELEKEMELDGVPCLACACTCIFCMYACMGWPQHTDGVPCLACACTCMLACVREWGGLKA